MKYRQLIQLISSGLTNIKHCDPCCLDMGTNTTAYHFVPSFVSLRIDNNVDTYLILFVRYCIVLCFHLRSPQILYHSISSTYSHHEMRAVHLWRFNESTPMPLWNPLHVIACDVIGTLSFYLIVFQDSKNLRAPYFWNTWPQNADRCEFGVLDARGRTGAFAQEPAATAL